MIKRQSAVRLALQLAALRRSVLRRSAPGLAALGLMALRLAAPRLTGPRLAALRLAAPGLVALRRAALRPAGSRPPPSRRPALRRPAPKPASLKPRARRPAARLALAAALAAVSAPAPAAAFDYWLMTLSWSPSWCAAEGDAGAEQCAPERDLGFVLHGLWPQNERGWPEYCDTAARPPSRRETAAMADIMGSGGLAFYTWKKHGTCSGLSATDYFATSRLAFGLVKTPAIPRRTTAARVEAALLDANPGLSADSVVVTCRDGLLREVRICLDRNLSARPCGADVLRSDCRPDRALSAPAAP